MKSAEQGEAQAQVMVADLYGSGKGVRRDYKKAKEYYGRGCDKGDQRGCGKYKKMIEAGR